MTWMLRLFILASALQIPHAPATSIWEEGHPTPVDGIENPYKLGHAALQQHIRQGKLHALQWPVEVTGPLLPYRPIRCLLDANCYGWPFGAAIFDKSDGDYYGAPRPSVYVGPYNDAYVEKHVAPYLQHSTQLADLEAINLRLRELYQTTDDEVQPPVMPPGPTGPDMPKSPYFFDNKRTFSFDWWTAWLGLHEYPTREGSGSEGIPYPFGKKPDYRMGVSLIERNGVNGVTFSCAACHLGQLFGQPVMGMTTRFPRANKFIYHSSRLIHEADPFLFRISTRASVAEVDMLMDLKPIMSLVDTRVPQVLGLDTALAQVGMSLRLRGLAGNGAVGSEFPVSDSKPSVWWNVRYKNRWLSDGSLVAGNPVVTNILWNEIGRGSDLADLEGWLQRNATAVQELTAMVYASSAPHITDFFSPGHIDIDSARRGETLFNEHCSGCHGKYIKYWSAGDAAQMSAAKRLKTSRVEYPEQTKVKDVGTDPRRYKALHHLLSLNDLAISKTHGIKLKVAKGYVPPPLVGIWARWPYFHNNSAPTLCAVLEAAPDRPRVYFARPALDRNKDFDFDCNGYPQTSSSAAVLKAFSDYRYDTTKPGMSNAGHDQGILIEDGQALFSKADKKDLISFLQTL